MQAAKKNPSKYLVLLVICFSLLMAMATSANAVEYQYTELLPPEWVYAGGMSGGGIDINDNGVVVGSGYQTEISYGQTRGFIYSEGEYTELLPPGWIDASCAAINNNGVVVGEGTDGNQVHKMFIKMHQNTPQLCCGDEWLKIFLEISVASAMNSA